jgi:hypothetical protein
MKGWQGPQDKIPCVVALERGGSECVWRSVTQLPWLAGKEEEKARGVSPYKEGLTT